MNPNCDHCDISVASLCLSAAHGKLKHSKAMVKAGPTVEIEVEADASQLGIKHALERSPVGQHGISRLHTA